jgi:hypothetical protein
VTARGHREDVAFASAALLFNLIPEILKLPPAEQYRRLVDHMLGCLAASYDDVPDEFFLPDPSDN